MDPFHYSILFGYMLLNGESDPNWTPDHSKDYPLTETMVQSI